MESAKQELHALLAKEQLASIPVRNRPHRKFPLAICIPKVLRRHVLPSRRATCYELGGHPALLWFAGAGTWQQERPAEGHGGGDIDRNAVSVRPPVSAPWPPSPTSAMTTLSSRRNRHAGSWPTVTVWRCWPIRLTLVRFGFPFPPRPSSPTPLLPLWLPVGSRTSLNARYAATRSRARARSTSTSRWTG